MQTPNQTQAQKPRVGGFMRGLLSGNTCPYSSQGDHLTLSSLHMRYIPHVVMPILKISSRSRGPSWKRGRGSHTNKYFYYTKNYLIKD
jgi:hypothetical protein